MWYLVTIPLEFLKRLISSDALEQRWKSRCIARRSGSLGGIRWIIQLLIVTTFFLTICGDQKSGGFLLWEAGIVYFLLQSWLGISQRIENHQIIILHASQSLYWQSSIVSFRIDSSYEVGNESTLLGSRWNFRLEFTTYENQDFDNVVSYTLVVFISFNFECRRINFIQLKSFLNFHRFLALDPLFRLSRHSIQLICWWFCPSDLLLQAFERNTLPLCAQYAPSHATVSICKSAASMWSVRIERSA